VALRLLDVPPERRTNANADVVVALAQSIQRRGLLSPIRVSEPSASNQHAVLLGVHRVLAHESLDLPTIDAIVTTGSQLDLELDEIEENLVRRELSLVERAAMLARQKALYLLRNPETKKGTAGGLARHGQQATSVSFATVATKARSRRATERLIQIGETIPAELVTRLVETPIANNQAQLLLLARLPSDIRAQAAALIAAGTARTVRDATNVVEGAAETRPAPRVRTARVLLESHANGYTGNISLWGRDLSVFVSKDFLHVDLDDAGPTKPQPVLTGDDEPLRLETFEQAVKEVLADLPAEVANDVTTQGFSFHIAGLSGIASGNVQVKSPGGTTTNFRLGWFPGSGPTGEIEEHPPHALSEMHWVGILGSPTRRVLRHSLRRFLAHRILRTTHGHAVANAVLERRGQ
jgi:ParB family chromosome partitioning protein